VIYEKAAAKPTKIRTKTKYQAKTQINAVERFSFVTLLKPIAASTRVQISKRSKVEAKVYKGRDLVGSTK
jgi:hypothetical protein